jgi:exopolysaccharide production protein ExoQ
MARLIATLICALGIWGLFRLDRQAKVRSSIALWIPMMWLFIAASRNVSAWLQYSPGDASDQYLEGSPLDRAALTAILALGVIVLFTRGRRVFVLLQSNIPILLYFLYCGVSMIWSDFPDVSFKRWFRAMGDVVMVLIVLTEPDWLGALKRLLARLAFLLLPLSVLFIRYYPELGRTYSRNGRPFWVGVATDKNALGMLCLVCGLAAIFRFIVIYRGEEGDRKMKPLIAQGALIVMTLYLIRAADSATALACFLLAGGVMVATCLFRLARKPVVIHVMVVAVLGVAFSALFLQLGTGMVEGLGRESTLTGRTTIWHYALGMVHNPVFGTGFESFWVGPRREKMIVSIDQTVNQAHNGYIEIFLNLGWIGVALLAGLIVTGYRRIVPAVRRQTQAGSLRLAYCIVAVAYNFTEAGFKMMNPVWFFFLLSIAIVPATPILKRRSASAESDRAHSLSNSPTSAQGPTEPESSSPEFVTPRKGSRADRHFTFSAAHEPLG